MFEKRDDELDEGLLGEDADDMSRGHGRFKLTLHRTGSKYPIIRYTWAPTSAMAEWMVIGELFEEDPTGHYTIEKIENMDKGEDL